MFLIVITTPIEMLKGYIERVKRSSQFLQNGNAGRNHFRSNSICRYGGNSVGLSSRCCDAGRTVAVGDFGGRHCCGLGLRGDIVKEMKCGFDLREALWGRWGENRIVILDVVSRRGLARCSGCRLNFHPHFCFQLFMDIALL